MEWTDWGDALERTSQNLTPEERQVIASLPYSPVSENTTIWLRPAAYYAAEKTLLAVSDELTQHQWEVALQSLTHMAEPHWMLREDVLEPLGFLLYGTDGFFDHWEKPAAEDGVTRGERNRKFAYGDTFSSPSRKDPLAGIDPNLMVASDSFTFAQKFKYAHNHHATSSSTLLRLRMMLEQETVGKVQYGESLNGLFRHRNYPVEMVRADLVIQESQVFAEHGLPDHMEDVLDIHRITVLDDDVELRGDFALTYGGGDSDVNLDNFALRFSEERIMFRPNLSPRTVHRVFDQCMDKQHRNVRVRSDEERLDALRSRLWCSLLFRPELPSYETLEALFSYGAPMEKQMVRFLERLRMETPDEGAEFLNQYGLGRMAGFPASMVAAAVKVMARKRLETTS